MMIKVYYLRQLKDDATNTEYTEGREFISHAISETTEKPNVRRVIIEENPNLKEIALKVEDATERDIEAYSQLPESVMSRDLFAEIDDLKARVEKLEKK